MEPIRYVDALNNKYGSMGFPAYKWSENETAPWTALTKPLSECTVALLVSGGISHCTAPAFDPDARNDHRVDAREWLLRPASRVTIIFRCKTTIILGCLRRAVVAEAFLEERV